MTRHIFFLTLILLIGALLRFTWLDRIPHSVNGDQLHYLLSAKSFALTGKDITQTVNPLDILFFKSPPTEMAQAELPYFLDMLTVGWLPFSLAGNALPNSVLSFLIIILMYLITKKLFDEKIALIAGLVTAINPWFIVMGRTSYEMITATFFYLCGFYVLLIARKWRILFALPFFILAFYSYIATKLIFLPIILAFCAYCYFVVNKKHFAKQYFVLLLLVTLFVGFYFLQIKSSSQTDRLSEIISPSSPAISAQVDAARKTAIKNPLLYVFENKFTIFSKTLNINAFQAISPDYLFIHGDYFFLLGKHGFFYPLDFVFLILGFMWLSRKNKNLILLLMFLITVSVFPQIIHNSSAKTGNFSPHITLLIPFFIIIIAAGIWQAITFFKQKRNFIWTIVVVFYLLLLGNFVNVYFFEMPLQHNFYNFPNRLLSQYVSLAKITGQDIFVYTPNPQGKFQEYLFYANAYNTNTVQTVTSALQNRKYTINNVSFVSCDRQIKNVNSKDTAITHLECDMIISGDIHTIPELSDSGKVYAIVNDKLCSTYELKPYISGFKISDFNLDRLSLQQFCQTFIMVR